MYLLGRGQRYWSLMRGADQTFGSTVVTNQDNKKNVQGRIPTMQNPKYILVVYCRSYTSIV